MQNTPEQFRQLIEKYLADTITAAEKAQLFQMISGGEYAGELEESVAQKWAQQQHEEEDLILREQIFDTIKAHHKKIKRLKILRWSAAAAVAVILVTAGGMLWLQPFRQTTPEPATIQPGGNKAVLILGDRSEVMLDSTGNRVISQGSATVSLKSGQLVYTPDGQASGEITYNTLRTARGGQYRLTLPDGTRIWVNAASTVRYPVTFPPGERRIAVTGEVYIEAAPEQRPFIVATPHETVQVLGTSFNINAYADERATLTTLLSGKVRVVNNQQAAVTLRPGEQATVSPVTVGPIPVTEVDTEQAVAWKNGYFEFENERLDVIVRRLSRWYNVDFDVEAAVATLQFSAVIERSSPLEQVLSALSATEAVKFSREGNTIKAYTFK